MELKRLRLRNHRNYAPLDLVPGEGVNVFIGPNGQGKTNLLEAVAMLALSSSPRARRDIELVGPIGPGPRLTAAGLAGAPEVGIELGLDVGGRPGPGTVGGD